MIGFLEEVSLPRFPRWGFEPGRFNDDVMQLHLLPPGLALLEIPAVGHQQRVHRHRRQHRPNRVHEHGLLERPGQDVKNL